MAVQTTEEFKNGGATSYAFTIEYLKTSDIKVRIDGTLQTYVTSSPSSGEYTVSGTSVTLGAQAAAGSGNVHIYRETDVNTAAAVFAAGSSIKAADLNAIHDMARMGVAEARSKILTSDIKEGQVTSTEILDGTIVNADISGSAAIAQSKIATGNLPSGITVNSDNIVDGSIVAGDIQTGTLDSRYFTETELTDGQLDSRYYTETELDAGQLDNRYFTETELGAGSLDGRYYTEVELDAGQLDNRYYTETEAEALFLRQDSSETIASGETWSNADDKVATTAAINARIIDLVDDIGGFTVIANETSFPNTNPQGGTGQAAIMSIGALTQAYTPSGTTVTIANGTIGNSTVTITGVPSVLPQGFGILVESTTTLNTYTFHRLVPKATEVTTVAGSITNINNCGNNLADIENFADLYQISTSAPTTRADGTALTIGDLWFDSSSNQVIMVYDGSSGDGFSPITPDQSTITAINSVSGHVTFTEDLGLITNAVNTGSGNNSINTCGANIASINTVAADLNEATSEIDTVATNITNINNVGNSIANVDAVAANETNINAVKNNETNINAVQANASNINAAVSNASNINAAVSNATDISAVAANNSNITAVANNETNINAVKNNSTNINTTATNISDVNNFVSRYQISSSAPTQRADGTSLQNGDLWFNNTSVAMESYDGSAGDGYTPIQPSATTIQNIANVTGYVTYVEDNGFVTDAILSGSGNNSINACGANIADIVTVANDLNESVSEINTVAGSIANVNTVGNDIANVNAVAGNATNVNAVATNASNINAAVANASNINSAVSNATNINSVASNIGDVNSFVDRYQISSSAPTQREDGTSLQNGDLWFNNSSQAMEAYDGSGGDGYTPIQPSATVIENIANVTGFVTFVEDNGFITDTINTGTGNNSINAVGADIANVNTTAGSITNVNTVAGAIANVNTTAGSITSVNTVAGAIADVNRYANEYIISSSAPSSPSQGDLWFSTTANILNYYTGSSWTNISPGIAGLVNDSNPNLAGNLDANNYNLTEVGTISGNNLQLDFGTL